MSRSKRRSNSASSEAIALREKMFDREKTNCYRLINAEGDGLPGLIVDIYDDLAVMQINTYGMERLKPMIVEKLKAKLKLRGIYEKSHSSARRQEGLADLLTARSTAIAPKKSSSKKMASLFLSVSKRGKRPAFFSISAKCAS